MSRKIITLTNLQNFFSDFRFKNLFVAGVVVSILGVLGFNLWLLAHKPPPTSPIGEQLISENITLPEGRFAQVLSEATKSATPQVLLSPAEGKVAIALLGDSMIDTLGDLKNLRLSLSQYYPKVEFNLLNYGVGATKPADGLIRLAQSTQTETKNLQPLLQVKPDIVVLESFAYNHEKNTPDDIATHYKTLKEIADTLSRSDIKVLFLVTIAPTKNYAQGAPGILWDENQRLLEAQTVIEYLKAGLKFGKSNNLTLIDGFTPSLDKDGFGKPIYVNSADNIHPSQEGIEFISDLIAQKIFEERTIEKILGHL